jgi:tetratricopeptide (TPR) repeat protein
MAEQLKVIISSTAHDLPEHRKEVMAACLRQGMFPSMMEHLPANDSEAISASLKLVDEAEIYVGVFAYRYGHVPRKNNARQISVTEMEYNRAIERRIPRLIFVMDKTHPITIDDIEQGASADKLKAFKERVQSENIVNFFRSPADLRAHVINSLSQLRKPDLETFHYVSDIPGPPEAFIAHPYTLLQTPMLIGRQKELKLLTDWVTGKELESDKQKLPADSVSIVNVVAIGGIGKSALTWEWFKVIAPREMKHLAGRMWWSFYESDATFENFVIRALAYVSKRAIGEVTKLPSPERETQLLAALNHQPFLLVLDGLERILIAYARMDAARLGDNDVGKEKDLRKTADPRADNFLRKLAQLKKTRVLISSRLHPAEMETSGGDPIPGCFRIQLEGLIDEDAIELWRAFGVSGSREDVLSVFNTFAKHPLLIQVLSGEVKRYRKAPGSFEDWSKANRKFDPEKYPDISKAMGHVLEFALRGLPNRAQQVLQVIAAFRMPARYDTLAALLVGKSWLTVLFKVKAKPCTDERELDVVLTELEDRGLVGWDKRANRYDLHPIVRCVVWDGLSKDIQRGVYKNLHVHFEALIKGELRKVTSPEDLTPAIELYNTLINLGRSYDAFIFFAERLSGPMLNRFAIHQRIELLEMLFPDGLDQLPRLNGPDYQAHTLGDLATGYLRNGQPERAALFYSRANSIYRKMKAPPIYKLDPFFVQSLDFHLSINLFSLSCALLPSGHLRECEAALRHALTIIREQDSRSGEATYLCRLGLSLSARGLTRQSESALWRAAKTFTGQFGYEEQGYVKSYLAQRALWLSNFTVAQLFADTAWEMYLGGDKEAELISSARRQGEASLGLNDLRTADERLHHALTRARMVNHIEEELPTLVALAELRRRERDAKSARELLNDVWELAERGPYPLSHADAFNVLAQIELDEGNTVAAIEAAMKGYRLAWCDGPPFAYHWGLEKAKQYLRGLGAPEPEMPAFDESKFEPMPKVEIDSHEYDDSSLQYHTKVGTHLTLRLDSDAETVKIPEWSSADIEVEIADYLTHLQVRIGAQCLVRFEDLKSLGLTLRQISENFPPAVSRARFDLLNQTTTHATIRKQLPRIRTSTIRGSRRNDEQ